MNTPKRIDRVSLMITRHVTGIIRDILGDDFEESQARRVIAEVFENTKVEIEAYENSVERWRIEPGKN